MDLIRENKIIFAVTLPILILILIRTFNTHHFKSDARKWAEPSVVKSNTVTVEQAENLPGEILLINLSEEKPVDSGVKTESLDLTPESILNKKNFKVIRNHEGPVLLYSSQKSVSARIWMILSQMGCTNIYILYSDIDDEVLKYKFRPDSLIRPEI